MATMHPLKKLGIADSSVSPAPESWQELLRRVSQWYTDADQERYLLERSLNISSREMQELSGSLRSERDRLSAILSSLGDGLCALDPEGRLLFINPKGEQLLGWREEELVGRVLLAMVAVMVIALGFRGFLGRIAIFLDKIQGALPAGVCNHHRLQGHH